MLTAVTYIFSVNSSSFSDKHRDMKYTTVYVVSQRASQSNDLLTLCSLTNNQRKRLKRKKMTLSSGIHFKVLHSACEPVMIQSKARLPRPQRHTKKQTEVNWAQMHLHVPIGSACCSANSRSRPRFPHEDTEALFICALILGHSLVHTYLHFYWTSQQIGAFKFVPSA